MKSLPLVRSQLVPPRIKQVLQRQHLNELGDSILSHRITTVVAPAGYGKSVLLSTLLEEPGWPLTAWLSLDHHDIDPSLLLYHLIHAVKMVVPGFGLVSMRTVGNLESMVLDWSIAVNTIIAELPQEQELLIVLDDFHLIHENKVVCAIIEHLLRWLPANIHLVLITRSSPRLNLYRHQLEYDLFEIKQEHLLFSREETHELLELMDLDLEERTVTAIHAYTEGWAVGLRLAGILIKASDGDPKRALQALKQADSSLNKYLNNELLASLPGKLQDFLMDASLLPYLEENLCNAAFQCQDSSLKLEQLHAYGLLSLVEGEDLTWRMHHLIAEFLENKAVKLRPPEYIMAIRKRAGAFFENYGDIDRAIEQAMVCSDWNLAASIITRYGYDYFTLNGRLDALDRWINLLPPEMVARDPWLCYFKGKSVLHIDDDAALALLVAAANMASSQGNIQCEACCLLAMSSALVYSGGMENVKEVGQHLLTQPSLLKDPQAHGIALTIALGQTLFEDDLPRGMKLSRQALCLELSPENRMLVLYGSTMIYQRLGNLVYARQLAEEALAMPFVQDNERWAVTGYVVLSQILNLAGETVLLEETCRKIIHLSQKYGMPSQLGRAHRQLGRMYLPMGRFIEARREMELAYHYAVDNDSVPMSKLVALELMRLRLKTGEDATDLLVETQQLLTDLKAFPVGLGGDNYSLALAAIVAIEAGELDLARQWLEEANEIWRQIGARQNLAGTNLLLAHIYLLQGNEKTADSLLRRALGAAEAGQWVYFREWHEETIYTMCRRAILKNIHVNWALHLLSRWFPMRSHQELGRFLVSSDDSLRSQISSVLSNYFQETSIPTIHTFYLNGFRVFVNGSEVFPHDWKTQKAESLFKFLVANRSKHSKEELIELFWPDSNYASGEASLRMALSHVRQALGVHESIKNIVILNRGIIHLNPALEIYTDHELFSAQASQAMQYEESESPYAINALEQALHLYSGSFLAGDMADDWVYPKRVSLHRLYLQVMLKLAQLYYDKGYFSASLPLCRQYLALEPVDEQPIRLAMQIHSQSGHKRQALSLYRELEKTLANEYNTTPEPETIALSQRLI